MALEVCPDPEKQPGQGDPPVGNAGHGADGSEAIPTNVNLDADESTPTHSDLEANLEADLTLPQLEDDLLFDPSNEDTDLAAAALADPGPGEAITAELSAPLYFEGNQAAASEVKLPFFNPVDPFGLTPYCSDLERALMSLSPGEWISVDRQLMNGAISFCQNKPSAEELLRITYDPSPQEGARCWLLSPTSAMSYLAFADTFETFDRFDLEKVTSLRLARGHSILCDGFVMNGARVGDLVRATPQRLTLPTNDLDLQEYLLGPNRERMSVGVPVLLLPGLLQARSIEAAYRDVASRVGIGPFGSYAGHTERGRRPTNEDGAGIYLPPNGVLTAVVFDGVATNRGGREACEITAQGIGPLLESGQKMRQLLETALPRRLQEFYLARAAPYPDMSVLLAAAEIHANTVRFHHIGDPRGMLIRNIDGNVAVVEETIDQHSKQDPRTKHNLTPAERDAIKGAKIVKNALGLVSGIATKGRPRSSEWLPLQAGDWVVLVSDGVTTYLGSEEIASIVALSPSPQAAIVAVMQKVRSLASKGIPGDNIVIFVYRHDGPPLISETQMP